MRDFSGRVAVVTGSASGVGLAPERDAERPPPTLEALREMIENAGIAFAVTEPEEVADYTLAALREDRFWILPPSADQDARLRERTASILERRTPVLARASEGDRKPHRA